jgi:hypothetical protein
MSLQLIAKQMEAKGRDGDSVLVHMTPGEVEGLQKLAKSAGGTLTVNPETGLVEANFLRSILPAVAGVVGTKFFGPLGGQIAGTLAGSLVGGKDGPQGSTEQGVAGRVRAGENVQLRSPYEMPGNKEDYPYAYGSGRPVVAAQGGLMHLAEGGMTGASGDAFDYLMGNRPTAVQAPVAAAQAASPAQGAPSNKMFSFDPATGTFVRNPNYVDPMAKRNEPTGLMSMMASGDTGMSGAPGDPVTDAQMAEFYAENPTMGRFTRAVQEYNPFASLQERMDPGFTDRARDATFGGSFSPGSANAESVAAGLGDIGYSDAPADMSGFDSQSDGSNVGGLFAAGGLMGISKGGMASGGFVVPADVVSALGNGSTDAGLRSLKSMLGGVKPIKGEGDGLSDSIKTNIDGKQPARVADGEAYIDPKTVKRIGGAQKLYSMMDKIRAQAHGKTTQQRKVNPAKV